MTRLLLGSAIKKPVTTTYPAVRLEMPDRFRGKIAFQSALCIGCRLCMRDCPTGAIEIRKVGEKEFEAEIDFSKCIYCAQCVDVCPKKALEATGDFELAQLSRGALKTLFPAQPREALPPEKDPPTGSL
jgi:formate hydrogenlyase subunit 6/NADH:ubiquinone oxidoreductase subunit I